MTTISHLDDVLELAAHEAAGWGARSAALRASGVPLNDGASAVADPKKQLAELNEAVTEKGKEFRSVQKDVKAKREAVLKEFDGKWAEAVASEDGRKKLGEIDNLFEKSDALGDEWQGLKDARRALTRSVVEHDEPDEKRDGTEGAERKNLASFGERFTKSSAFAELKELGVGRGSEIRFGTKNFGEITTRAEAKAILSGVPGAGAGDLVTPERRATVENPLRPLRILDLITLSTTDSNTIEHPVLRTRTNNAGYQVTEGTKKAESNYAWELEDFPVRTIAHFTKISRQTIEDIPRFQAIVERLMREDLALKLETEVLLGDGSAGHLTGALKTVGRGAYVAPDGESKIRSVRRAMTKVTQSFFSSTATVINPFDFEEIELEREASGATQNTGGFLVGDPRGGAVAGLWRAPIVESFAIPQGTFATGYWPEVDLATRAGVTARATDTNEDDFVKNLFTILVEGRWALPIGRPAAIVEGTFDAV